MILKPHKKHASIPSPTGGKFGPNELAIIGAPCDVIQHLSKAIADASQSLTIGYADAYHKEEGEPMTFKTSYTAHKNHHELSFGKTHDLENFRELFQHCDAVLVNGNHFYAAQQIVIFNEKKRASLEQKLDRLTQVKLFILDDDVIDIYPFLETHLKDHKSIPRYSIKDVAGITSWIQKNIKTNSSIIKGLVLAGGQSSRMGHDKGAIDYLGKPHREYLADLLSDFCDPTYLSVQKASIDFQTNYPLIADSFLNLGPYGGILSAFREDPTCAWLVIATDLPKLDKDTLKQLIDGRNSSKMATCFHNPATKFPEPLLTLWEPRSYPILLSFLANGYSCPRKVLINGEIEELQITQHEALLNVNTPEELKALRTN